MIELEKSKSLDHLDKLILDILQKDGQLSNAEIARRVNLSPPATHSRIKQLEKHGFIDRHVAILNQEKLGFDLLCFVHVKMSAHYREQLEDFERSVGLMDGVLECHQIAGQYDYLLKVVTRDRKELQKILRELNLLPNANHLETSVVLQEIKFSTTLPFLDNDTD